MEHIPSTQPAIRPTAGRETPDKVASVHRKISAEVTRLIAAIALAHEAFPREDDLPRLDPVPYNQLGHQVLVDYRRLALILWGTVREIQTIYRKSPGRITAPLLCLFAIGVGISICVWANLAQNPGPPMLNLLAILSGVVVGFSVYAVLKPKVARIAADVRAKNMRLLLQGNEPPSAEEFAEAELNGKHLAVWGGGELDKTTCPVLVMTADSQPFPGYGRHQTRQLFICRPKDEKSPPALSHESLNASVAEALIRMAYNSGLSCVSSGQVVLIDGRTLRKDSPWLNLGSTARSPTKRATATSSGTAPGGGAERVRPGAAALRPGGSAGRSGRGRCAGFRSRLHLRPGGGAGILDVPDVFHPHLPGRQLGRV